MSIRTYSELVKLPTYEDRLNYLKTNSKIGDDTFGFNRYINQNFYSSKLWKQIRDEIIIRDKGDLGLEEREYNKYDRIVIHHMNPITPEDIINLTEIVVNPEYLISVTNETHQLIHYSSDNISKPVYGAERTPNDTCPWKK